MFRMYEKQSRYQQVRWQVGRYDSTINLYLCFPFCINILNDSLVNLTIFIMILTVLLPANCRCGFAMTWKLLYY